MEGFKRGASAEDRGIIPRAIEQVFAHIQRNASPRWVGWDAIEAERALVLGGAVSWTPKVGQRTLRGTKLQHIATFAFGRVPYFSPDAMKLVFKVAAVSNP